MELVLSSSPVWYQTKASDTSSDGYFAFASRNLVYLLDIRKDTPRHYGILSGHEERVTSCSFCHNKEKDGQLYLVSGGDDSAVKIWNVVTRTLVIEHKAHGPVGKVIAVHWSPLSEDLVVSGDDKGCLIVWDARNSTNKYFPDSGHQPISCVICSPHYKHLVAVAYKSGAVSIVDIQKRGQIFRKLRGHGNEVQSVVWSVFPSENIFGNSRVDCDNEQAKVSLHSSNDDVSCIIATGSKDRTIRLWSLSKGRCLKILKLPSRPSKGRRIHEDTTRLYVTLFWPQESESRFLSSSYNGDVLLWDVSKTDKELYQVLSSQSPDAGHQRIVFNINAGLDPRNSIITTSMDRYIKQWSLLTPQAPPTCSLPTLGGYVYAIAICPIDPSIVALGIGDGVIRIWKTKNPRNPFDITVLWQGVKEKVMSLAWHPTKEGILAFGTEDGKVGLYDVLSQRAPTISENYHLKPVYAMSWGPQCYIEESSQTSHSSKLCLYTCGGEGVVLMHASTLKGDGVNIDTIICSTNQLNDHHPCRHSEVNWRSNMVAIGNDNGTYDVYVSPYLQRVVTVKVHNKIINCLSWNPVSKEHASYYWIASGSNNSNVCVTNLRKVIESLNLKNGNASQEHNGQGDGYTVPVITDPYRTLSGHNGRITGLSWNFNNPSQLVSASYDGTLQVWDVIQGEGISNYRGHDGRSLCVDWSPVVDGAMQSGVIFSGADDYSVHVWRHEVQENKTPPKDIQHVGYTQKQSAQWKRKNKKKKSSNAAQNKSPELPSSSQENHDMTSNIGLEVNLDALLEQKKQELIADMDSGNKGVDESEDTSPLFAQSELNPCANPWQLPSTSSGDVKAILSELSESRKITMETKEDDSSHCNLRKRLKNLFPLSIALDNRKKEHQQQDCIDIVKFKNGQLSCNIPEQPNIGLYGDRKAAYRMLHEEDKKLVEAENYDGSYTLKLWRADIVGAIQSAIERNDLTDQLVAMAPMAGNDVWLHACDAFAEQLSKEGLHLHATHYLLACNKVHEAIILLRDHKHYREAVAMARARLHDDDELLIATVKTWAHKLRLGGAFEMSAKCYASINDFSSAASCLAERASSKSSSLNRDDLRSLFAASIVAKAGNLPESRDYIRRALSSVTTQSGRWKDAQIAAKGFNPDLSSYRLILCTHELLLVHISSSLPNDTFSLDNIFTDHAFTEWVEPKQLKDSNFAEKVLQTWSNNILPAVTKPILLYDEIKLFVTSSVDGMTLKRALYEISLHLTCAMLLLQSKETSRYHGCKEHVTSSMAITGVDDVKPILDGVFENLLNLLDDLLTSTNGVGDVMEHNITALTVRDDDVITKSNSEITTTCDNESEQHTERK